MYLGIVLFIVIAIVSRLSDVSTAAFRIRRPEGFVFRASGFGGSAV